MARVNIAIKLQLSIEKNKKLLPKIITKKHQTDEIIRRATDPKELYRKIVGDSMEDTIE